MRFHPGMWVCAGLMAALAGCSVPPDQVAGGALNSAGQATVDAADTAGQAGVQVLGTAGEATAAATRGVGEAAAEVTGGQGGLVKDVQKAADDFAKPKNVDVMGNDVVIDPSEDKKIRMAF